MHTVKERTLDEGSRNALKQMTILQHIWHSMLCIANKRHRCTCLMCTLTTVERLVSKIVLHRVNKYSIYIATFLLFKLVPCHNVPVTYQSKIMLQRYYLHEKKSEEDVVKLRF